MSGRARRRLATGSAALLAGLLLTACTSSGGGTSGQGGGGQSFVAGDGAITVLPADQRPTPGRISGTTIEGTPVDLTSYRGQAVVLNVWGSWCAPCQKEAPELEKAAKELGGKGVRFLGINTREGGNKAQAAAFQQAYGISYPSIFDAGSDSLLALRGAVAPNAIPTTVVLDAQGRIAARVSGATTATTLVDVVDDVLAGRTATS